MKTLDEQILRAVKEIVVKFIEAGRISPTSFNDSFREIYQTVSDTAKGVDDITASEDPDKNNS